MVPRCGESDLIAGKKLDEWLCAGPPATDAYCRSADGSHSGTSTRSRPPGAEPREVTLSRVMRDLDGAEVVTVALGPFGTATLRSR